MTNSVLDRLSKLTTTLPDRVRSHWPDLVLLLFLMVEASLLSFGGAQWIDPVIVEGHTEDVWFGSDIGRVFGNVTDRGTSNFRSKVHPIFSILLYCIVKPVQFILQTSPLMAVQIVIALTAALWVGVLYMTLRLLGCRRLDATLYSVLALTSAAFIFWFVIPESFAFGSLSLILPVGLVALSQVCPVSRWWHMLANAFSLSITTTNWMAGLLATFVCFKWKRAIGLTAIALALVTVIWAVQYRYFAATKFFIGDFQEEVNYFLPRTSGGPLYVILAFFSHTLVMPDIVVLESNRNDPDWPLLSAQLALPGSSGMLGLLSVAVWLVLLGLGVWGFWRDRGNQKLRIVIGLTLLGQLVLHLVYGEETFLYAIHIVPFLIFIAAFGGLTRARVMSLSLTVVLIVTMAINNGVQFHHTAAFLKDMGPLRSKTPIRVHQQIETTLPVPKLLLLKTGLEAPRPHPAPGIG